MGKTIEFKGVSNGVYLKVKSNDLDVLKNDLQKTMKRSSDFFKGTNLLGIINEDLSLMERLELAYFLKFFYDFKISESNFEDICGKIERLETEVEKLKDENEKINGLEVREEDLTEEIEDLITEGMTKFVYGTLRSGQEVAYPGNIVIVGDVNPGGFLKADGNIIVLGKLMGVAYAGLNGNEKAVVAAYDLAPSQLRIGDLIVRAPDGDKSHNRLPEIARVLDDRVIIETYLPNK